MSLPQLEGKVQPDEAVRLKREIAGLEQELSDAKHQRDVAVQAAKDSVMAVNALRKLLEPDYRVMRMIFGEISRVEAEADEPSVARGSSNGSLWAERITKATPAEGRILQVLLDGGGEMTLTQIRQAAGTYNNTSTYLNRLKAKNWVQQTGRGSYSLK